MAQVAPPELGIGRGAPLCETGTRGREAVAVVVAVAVAWGQRDHLPMVGD